MSRTMGMFDVEDCHQACRGMPLALLCYDDTTEEEDAVNRGRCATHQWVIE
jgi:hypothetical protein